MTLPVASVAPPWLDAARAAWAPRPERVVPLRVTAYLTAPVAMDRAIPLRLDGALTWLVVALATGLPPREAFGAIRAGEWVDLPTPIADAEVRGWRVPRCSDGVFPSVALDSVRRRRRRTDADALGLAKVQTNGGAWKALDMPAPTVSAPSVVWHCVADEERLCALLGELHALGRGRAGGLGAVGAWRVEHMPAGEDYGLTRDGMPTRALPVRDADEAERLYPGCEVRVDAVRPPHWHRAVKTLCACPVPAPGSVAC